MHEEVEVDAAMRTSAWSSVLVLEQAAAAGGDRCARPAARPQSQYFGMYRLCRLSKVCSLLGNCEVAHPSMHRVVPRRLV
jgi:hypothetical protein